MRAWSRWRPEFSLSPGRLGLPLPVHRRAPATCPRPRPARSPPSSMARRFKLTDGRTVRLIGAKAPMPPLGWRGEDPWPFVDEAREALGRAGREPAGRAEAGRQPPRPARSSARASLRRRPAAAALAAGGAGRQGTRPRLFAPRKPRLRRRASRPRSRSARPSGSACGLLGSTASASALDLKRLGRLTHSYQLVEGTVATVGEGGGRIYLNFAKDWRQRFHRQRRPQGRAPRLPPPASTSRALAGKRLRVRGFLGWRNGR